MEKEYSVTILPSENISTRQEEESVLDAIIKANLSIDSDCAGRGTCGQCKVRVLLGNDEYLDAQEQLLLTIHEKEIGFRLACRYFPPNDIVIEIPEYKTEDRKSNKVIITDIYAMDDMRVQKKKIIVDKGTLVNQASDVDRIVTALNTQNAYTISRKVLAKVSTVMKTNKRMTITLRDSEIIDIESGDTENQCYGVAIDVGTTTIVGMLWDLKKKENIGTISIANPQKIYGADIISRINITIDNLDKLLELQEMLHNSIRDLTRALIQKCYILEKYIYEYAIVGNTTMSHFVLGIDPTQLSRAPFVPVFCSSIKGDSSEFELPGAVSSEYYVGPNVAGHIGSDIVAGLVAIDITHKEGTVLYIDIGTNGEIVLHHEGKLYGCSTAAGPAFEGASIYMGMRAAEGAIEKVVINKGEVKIEVIGNITPVGICGSGIIDTVSQLLKEGLLDKSGKLSGANDCKKMQEKLFSRIRLNGEVKEFLLYDSEYGQDVVITQKDIREVQLAKAAIYAGTNILMKEAGISAEDLDEILIAGVFGSHVNIENIVCMGLIPDISLDRVSSVGNAAGKGASLLLISEKARETSEKIAKEILHFELSAREDFLEQYMAAMKF